MLTSLYIWMWEISRGFELRKGMCNFHNPCWKRGGLAALCEVDSQAPVVGAIVCICPQGYEGDGFEGGSGCRDVNECKSASACHETFERCVNFDGGYRCVCSPGFIERPDKAPGCVDLNECEHSTLNHCDPTTSVCRNLPGTYECVCSHPHHVLDPVTKICKPFDLCTDAQGAFNPCDTKRSYCVFDVEEGAFCVCKEGYRREENTAACEDINECEDETLNDCPPLISTCVNTEGSYRCECDEVAGYTQAHPSSRQKCTNLDECTKWPGLCGDFPCCLDLPPAYPPRPFSGFTCAAAISDKLELNPFTSRGLVRESPDERTASFHHLPAPPLYQAHLLRPSSFVQPSDSQHKRQEEAAPSMLIRASQLKPHSRRLEESDSYSKRLQVAANVANSIPLLNSAGVFFNDAVEKVIQLNAMGTCPDRYINTHQLIRNRARTRTTNAVAEALLLPFQVAPPAVTRGILTNSQLAADDLAKWLNNLTALPPGLIRIAHNFSIENDLTKAIRFGSLVGAQLGDSAKRFGSLFQRAAEIRDDLLD